MPVKHPMLGSFEGLLKTMGHAFGQQPSQERTLVEEGSFLGRKWQLYSDGTIEGETVAGMQRFHNLEQFKSFIEVSPAVLDETSERQEKPAPAEPSWDALPGEASWDALPGEPPSGAEIAPTGPTTAGEFSAIAAELEDVQRESPADTRGTAAALPQSAPSRRDAELARNMVTAGALGIVLCVAWWLHFYVLGDLHGELVRRGMSGSLIGSTNRSPIRYVSCFVLNTDACMAVKTWGRFANYLTYEPAFLWASACVLILGFALNRAQKNRIANGAEE
jgi:hypothetical protein